MNIIILGSGTILSNERNPSGYLINNNNQLALIDCGPGILKRLIQLKIDILSISAVFLSHFHVDHYSDVFALMMRRYLKKTEINRKLTILGPVGLKYWFNSHAYLLGNWLADYMPILIEMHINEYEWNGCLVKSYPTIHTENSIAFKFIRKKRVFFYSSDTDYSEDLISFAKNTDLAILECSHSDENPVKGHLTPKKAADFINKAQIKNTILTHIYPENDTADLLERVTKYTNKNVHIAYDFMSLDT